MLEILQLIAIGCLGGSIILGILIRAIWKKNMGLPILTVGLFFAWCFLCFVEFCDSQTTADVDYIYGIVETLDATIAIFTMNMGVETTKQFLCHIKDIPQEWFTWLLYFLYFLAPVLMVGNIISIFHSFVDRLRFGLSWFAGNRYIMSEINSKSLAMAKSIRAAKRFSVIVFANTAALDKEGDNGKDLLEQARDLNSICLARKVSNIMLWKLFGKNEIFVIGDDESDNISQAIALTKKYKESWTPTSIYVYNYSHNAAEIIDSMNKGKNMLNKRFKDEIENNPEGIFDASWRREKNIKIEGKFFVCCVNPVEQTILEMLQENYLEIHAMAKKTKIVCISILGMGRYGMQLLKTAVWLFQLYGYRVTFNIFDLDKSIQEQIEHECPELIEKNGLQMSGEANYEIHFFTGIDCCTSAFEELLNSEKGQQIKDSQMFFVSLGQDDKNIEVAIQIRRFFAQEEAFEAASMVEQLQDQNEREAQAKAERDRLQNKDLGDEKPLIYAVVYSDQKVSNLNVDDGLKNFNGQSYGVRFVGAFSEENSYDRIIKKSGMERIAFQYHIEWVSKDDAEVSEELLKKAEHYVNYSYYRKSSMAQVIHQRVIKEIMEEIDDISVKEHIDRKEIIKVSEHMRWNAYMRQEGYRYCIVRNDRAKLHNNLVPFEQLSEDDKKKDIINYEVEQVR